MPEAFSTLNLVALPITSKELGWGGFFAPPTKIVLSNSPTTIGLRMRYYMQISTAVLEFNSLNKLRNHKGEASLRVFELSEI